MALSKQEVQARRSAIVGGIIGGTLLMVFVHFALSPISQNGNRADHLPLIGNISGWPWYMRSFWPLDLLEAMVAFGTLFYLLLSFHKIERVHGVRGWSMFGLWVVVGIGSMGSTMMSAMEGWIFGLFGFLALPVLYAIFFGALLAVAAVMAAAVSAMAGIGYLARNTWLGQWSRYWFKRLSWFLEAKDIPNEEPEQA